MAGQKVRLLKDCAEHVNRADNGAMDHIKKGATGVALSNLDRGCSSTCTFSMRFDKDDQVWSIQRKHVALIHASIIHKSRSISPASHNSDTTLYYDAKAIERERAKEARKAKVKKAYKASWHDVRAYPVPGPLDLRELLDEGGDDIDDEDDLF